MNTWKVRDIGNIEDMSGYYSSIPVLIENCQTNKSLWFVDYEMTEDIKIGDFVTIDELHSLTKLPYQEFYQHQNSFNKKTLKPWQNTDNLQTAFLALFLSITLINLI